jgi:serine/threonine protein kinase
MRAEPPAELVDRLERLQLATAADLLAVQGRVRQLANDLPLFPSVWVDALAQARKITPFQAAEINAGRGERLAIGSYLLAMPLLSLGYADYYRATDARSKRAVHLLVAPAPAKGPPVDTQSSFVPPADAAVAQSLQLIERQATNSNRHIIRPDGAGADSGRVWIAYPPTHAKPLCSNLERTGRMPGDAVLEVARQMAEALAALEAAGTFHGDLSPRTVWIDRRGLVQLALSGVRAVLQPDEDFARPDLPPDAYDYLAPERAADVTAANVSSDLFSCGCMWWHLAAGRPPFGGGTGRGKIRAIQAARMADLTRFAPNAPSALVAAVGACSKKDPRQRPESFQAVADLLGRSNGSGCRAVASVYGKIGGGKRGVMTTLQNAVHARDATAWMATLAACAMVVAAVAWPLMRDRTPPPSPPRNSPNSRPSVMPLANARPQPVRVHRDSEVVSTSYVEPDSNPRHDRGASEAVRSRSSQQSAVSIPPPVVLTAERPIDWSSTAPTLYSGQTVRGRPGERPLVVVPPAGLVVAVDDVRFENVDFIWRPDSDAPIDPERAALVELRASRACFASCTFQAVSRGSNARPVAVVWTGPRRAGPFLPAGRLELIDCVMSGVASGIDARLTAPLEIKIDNTLCLGPGPLLQFNQPPKADEPIEIALTNFTIRDAAGLVVLHCNRTPPSETGSIAITTNDCVLAPGARGALVLFAGSTSSADLAKSIQWSGQGSLSPTGARVAARVGNSGPATTDDVEVSIDGLVSGQIEFAGPPDAGSSASRVTHWLAAAHSADPPGIRDGLPNLRSPDVTGQ